MTMGLNVLSLLLAVFTVTDLALLLRTLAIILIMITIDYNKLNSDLAAIFII